MFRFGKNSLNNRKGINPKLIEIDDLAITLTLVDYGHGRYAGKRTSKLQRELYDKGVSRCDGLIRLSKHQSGDAIDFYAYVKGHASWQHDHLAMVACAYFQAASILGYKIKWGGLWRSNNPTIKNGIQYGWDLPHIILVD